MLDRRQLAEKKKIMRYSLLQLNCPISANFVLALREPLHMFPAASWSDLWQ